MLILEKFKLYEYPLKNGNNHTYMDLYTIFVNRKSCGLKVEKISSRI